jgi:tetratricopeptide (TPR) repeat protein
LALYQRRRVALLKRQSTLSSDYPHTVASTWALSFQQMEQENSAAADLLRLCAFLHPDAIPEDIFTQGAQWLGPVLQEVVTDPLQLGEAIQLLRRYSLLKRDPEAKLLNLHRLVQVVLKEGLDQAEQGQWAERVVRAVAEAFPQAEFANWARCELYLPHVQVCAQLIHEYHFSFPEAARLLYSAASYLCDRGQYAQSELLFQRALDMRKQRLGLEHTDTASTLNDLAKLYVLEGKYEQAEPLLQRTLAIRERVLGPEHPELAISLFHLGQLYCFQGKYEQAKPLLQRAHAIDERVLGPEHPYTTHDLLYLAQLSQADGQVEQAESLYKSALTSFERALGSEHPYVVETLTNLAQLYQKQGKEEQARSSYQRALTIREQALGSDHSDSFATREALVKLHDVEHSP